MPVPYTLDTVKALRHAERIRTPAAEIQQLLGWDDAMLTRVCSKHQIHLYVPAALPATVPTPTTTPSGGASDTLSSIISKLTPRQAQIFCVLQPHIDAAGQWSNWVNGAYIARIVGAPSPHSVIKSMAGLADRLRRIGAQYRIESRLSKGGGYRLVIDKGAE